MNPLRARMRISQMTGISWLLLAYEEKCALCKAAGPSRWTLKKDYLDYRNGVIEIIDGFYTWIEKGWQRERSSDPS